MNLNCVIALRIGFALVALGSTPVYAASCCASAGVFPGLITGDDARLSNLSFSVLRAEADALPDGTIRRRVLGDDELRQSIRVEGAQILADRWQAGFSLAVVRRIRSQGQTSAQSTGLGDASFQTSYEVLPEWEYSVWKQRIYAFLSLLVPTGRSIYESVLPFTVDVTGRGFYQLGSGFVILKRWSMWDLNVLTEVHKPFGRTVNTDLGVRTLSPGWGGGILCVAGYSPAWSALRLGLGYQYHYQGKISSSGAGFSSESLSEKTHTLIGQLSYLWSDSFMTMLSYSDSRLLGGARNSLLTRGVSILAQYRWAR